MRCYNCCQRWTNQIFPFKEDENTSRMDFIWYLLCSEHPSADFINFRSWNHNQEAKKKKKKERVMFFCQVFQSFWPPLQQSLSLSIASAACDQWSSLWIRFPSCRFMFIQAHRIKQFNWFFLSVTLLSFRTQNPPQVLNGFNRSTFFSAFPELIFKCQLQLW